MLLGRCPEWEYTNNPDHKRILTEALKGLLVQLRTAAVAVETHGVDTRTTHWFLFNLLVPPQTPYYAGHYRGEEFPCLVASEVGIATDPLVGAPSHAVPGRMGVFGEDLVNAVRSLDEAFTVPDAVVSDEQKLYAAVVVAARAFAEFLTVHPYVNGNGHLARFLVWLVLGRYDYWPQSWTIEPRPTDPNYGHAIREHRRGSHGRLEQLILEAIV